MIAAGLHEDDSNSLPENKVSLFRPHSVLQRLKAKADMKMEQGRGILIAHTKGVPGLTPIRNKHLHNQAYPVKRARWVFMSRGLDVDVAIEV